MKDSYDHTDKFNRSQQLSQLDHRIDDSMSAADKSLGDGAITNLESHKTLGKQTPGGVEMGGAGSMSQNMRQSLLMNSVDVSKQAAELRSLNQNDRTSFQYRESNSQPMFNTNRRSNSYNHIQQHNTADEKDDFGDL